MKCVIGSASERKINTAKKIFREYGEYADVDVQGYAAVSGVPDTPWDIETFQGAYHRAMNSKTNVLGAQYYIGLESGLVERFGHIYEEAWCAVVTAEGKEFFGYSSGLKVPDYVLHKMDELKMEHSDVMTLLEKEHDKLPNDTWGSYSGGVVLREVSLEEALRNALIQIVAPEESFYMK